MEFATQFVAKLVEFATRFRASKFPLDRDHKPKRRRLDETPNSCLQGLLKQGAGCHPLFIKTNSTNSKKHNTSRVNVCSPRRPANVVCRSKRENTIHSRKEQGLGWCVVFVFHRRAIASRPPKLANVRRIWGMRSMTGKWLGKAKSVNAARGMRSAASAATGGLPTGWHSRDRRFA